MLSTEGLTHCYLPDLGQSFSIKVCKLEIVGGKLSIYTSIVL